MQGTCMNKSFGNTLPWRCERQIFLLLWDLFSSDLQALCIFVQRSFRKICIRNADVCLGIDFWAVDIFRVTTGKRKSHAFIADCFLQALLPILASLSPLSLRVWSPGAQLWHFPGCFCECFHSFRVLWCQWSLTFFAFFTLPRLISSVFNPWYNYCSDGQ